MKSTHLLLALAFAAAPQCLRADPATADDACYKMAVRYTQLGFAMTPTNYTSTGGSGHTVKYNIPVSRGLDYVFLVGGDLSAKDIDIYVYSEVGNLILKDVRSDSRAGVKFRSDYNGTVIAYVHLARASGLASFSVMVGRRGEDKPAGVSGPETPVPDAATVVTPKNN
jgi:hypothetical protein